MRSSFKKVLFLGLMASALAYSAPAFAEDMPVDSVILSTSGLANFEHKAHVKGDATLEFPVRFEQVDDILKSLIVFDKQGRLGGVTLPGKQPLAQVFKDLPFTQDQLSNPSTLLNAYQGATVTIKGNVNATGKLLQVVPEEVALRDDKTMTKNRISIMTDDGMKSALMEDLESVTFEDAKIRAEISRALDSIRQNGTAERRVLSVNLLGDGARDVTLSYVVDAPLWKTAYRMVVPEAGAKKGMLQGWAVVENMTASDWKKVDLTLVSGNPVTFRQSLYQSYYVSRPEIPVQVFGRVMPRIDDGNTATAADMEAPAPAAPQMGMNGGAGAPMRRMAMKGLALGKVMAAPAAAPVAMMDSAVAPEEMNEVAQSAPAGMDSVAAAANAAQSSEATTQVLFRFPDRFDLKSGESMMLPFLSREVPMERVSLYQPETHPTHPLAAVEIQNDGDTGLPPGVLTLYEESALLKGTSFVGDAQIPVMGQGEKRMVSYALDSKTTVNRTDKSTSQQGKISISGGILRMAMTNRSETSYTVKAPPKEDRTVIIEHPKMYDYQIVTPDPKDVEVSGERYRIRVSLKAGETKTIPVVLEQKSFQSYGIDGMAANQLDGYASASGQLDDATRHVFEKLAAKRREIDALDMKSALLDQQRNQIFSDQERVRENLKSLSGKSDVQQRYLEKLNTQEDQIGKIDAEKQKLAEDRTSRMAELKDMINDMKIE
ncbi:MAG: DUF4139 domain-containing protein [Micavibrio sp.]|nr:DUF4139 domain-containing protein [Micavibrio sp.]